MNLTKWIYTAAGFALAFASISAAHASPVPEIDAGSGTTAIALLVGVLFLVGERLRRRAS